VNVWYSHNGERLGTYNGHIGAVWTVHVHRISLFCVLLTLATSNLLATGSADNTIKLWNVKDGTCLHTWEFPTAVKRVEFSEDGTMLLAVTEQRMGYSGSVDVYPINEDGPRISKHIFLGLFPESEDPIATIPTQESKATVAGWSFLDRYIIMGHENGMVSQWDWKVHSRRRKRC
jgi:translation initiation factor 3 subunit I